MTSRSTGSPRPSVPHRRPSRSARSASFVSRSAPATGGRTWSRSQGWDVIHMTQYPEDALPRQAHLRYGAVALVTDYDTGLQRMPGVEPVTQEQVFGFFEDNVHRVRDLLFTVIPRLAV